MAATGQGNTPGQGQGGLPAGGGAGGGSGGYTGLGGILSILQHGISAQQYGNIQHGYGSTDALDKGTGGIGGMHGAFGGLSPYAIQFLTENGILQNNHPAALSTTLGTPAVAAGADGTGGVAASGLTAQQVFMNQLLNGINAKGPGTYGLASGFGAGADGSGGLDLAGLLGILKAGAASGWGGQYQGKGIFEHGYNAAGKVNAKPGKKGK